MHTLNRETIHKVKVLAGILRVADGLDYTHQSIVKSLNLKVGTKRITVQCVSQEESMLEEQAFNKKKDLLEKVFDEEIGADMEATVKTAGQVVGFVDIGTNAVRLLVVRINPNFSYTIISQEKEVVRLGEQEFKDNILKPQAMERTIFVCRKFVELAKTYGATEIIAVGTSAIREAKNQCEFLQQLTGKQG